jgi:hypothetical protein
MIGQIPLDKKTGQRRIKKIPPGPKNIFAG